MTWVSTPFPSLGNFSTIISTKRLYIHFSLISFLYSYFENIILFRFVSSVINLLFLKIIFFSVAPLHCVPVPLFPSHWLSPLLTAICYSFPPLYVSFQFLFSSALSGSFFSYYISLLRYSLRPSILVCRSVYIFTNFTLKYLLRRLVICFI